jgi:hypothetical protein
MVLPVSHLCQTLVLLRSTIASHHRVFLFLLCTLLFSVLLVIYSRLSVTKNRVLKVPFPNSTSPASTPSTRLCSNFRISSARVPASKTAPPSKNTMASSGKRRCKLYPHLTVYIRPRRSPLFRSELCKYTELRHNVYLSLGFQREVFREIDLLYVRDAELVQLVCDAAYLLDSPNFFVVLHHLIDDYDRQPYSDILFRISHPRAVDPAPDNPWWNTEDHSHWDDYQRTTVRLTPQDFHNDPSAGSSSTL